MSDMTHRLESWRRVDHVRQLELERQTLLRQPPPNDPPYLSAPTRVKVIRGFMMSRTERAEPGQVVTVEFWLARDQVALKKAVLINDTM